ncbi:hypothetical protein Tco_0962137 [Tanacetum coccineum]
MDDEPMWAADHVVAPTPGSTITIPETANEFAIKGNHLTIVKGNQFNGRTKTDPHKHIHEFLGICDMFKYKDTENEAVLLMMFLLSPTGEEKTGKTRGFSKLKVQKSNSRVQDQDGKINTSSEVLIGGNPQGECHVNMKKAQRMGIFTLGSFS